MIGAPQELHEAVAVQIAELVDPAQCAAQRRLELAHELVVGGPAPRLREQHQKQGRGVDRAVVAREPDLGRAPAAQLVDDLAGLGVDARIVVLGLQVGQHPQGRVRELGPEDERLQARDDRVAPEHRHEPRHAGGRQQADAVAAAHAQRREVGDRTRVGLAEIAPGRLEPRHVHVPGLQRAADARALLAEMPRPRACDPVARDRCAGGWSGERPTRRAARARARYQSADPDTSAARELRTSVASSPAGA